MKVLCVLNVDEDMLKTVTTDDINQYNFDDAFKLEMRWTAASGIKLDGFVCLSEEEASEALSSYL